MLSVARIRALHDALGITSLAELRDACESGAVRGVARLRRATERRILDAIDAREAQGDAVLLPEAEGQGARILDYLRQSPAIERAPSWRARCAGASRP